MRYDTVLWFHEGNQMTLTSDFGYQAVLLFRSIVISFVKLIVAFLQRILYTILERMVLLMPSIKPVSDLRNYGEVLRDVAVGQPVFLTKNGRGRYAVIDIEEYREYEKMKAMNRLLSELNKGRISGEQDGWLSADEVFRDLEARYHA